MSTHSIYEDSIELPLYDLMLQEAYAGMPPPESFWYLCTPYDKLDHNQAWKDACKMTALLRENGFFVYCPIAESHGAAEFVSETNRNSHDFWVVGHDFKMIRLSRGLIVCTMRGWEQSKGINMEIGLALDLRLPIIYTEFMELPKI